MARLYGLNGLVRGRQGNNVFSIQNGTQVLKVYNPAVANPRTEAQQLQRAKFALAGKISAATPNDALVGMLGGSRRSRRARYVSELVRASVASVAANTYTARVDFTDFVFSKGSLGRYSTGFNITAQYYDDPSGNSIDVSAALMNLSASAPSGYGEIIVCGVFDGAGSPLDKIKVQVRSTTANAHFSFRQNVRSGFVAVAWIIPFVANNESAGLIAGNLGITTEHDAALVSSNPLIYVGATEFGQSVFNNLVWVPATTQSMAPSPDSDNRSAKKK